MTPALHAWAADKAVGVIVIMPPPPPNPAPPRVVQSPPVVLWLPQPQTAPHPPPPPRGRCYADAVICPLADASLVGRPCTCATKTGTVEGHGLIPPSTARAEPGPRTSRQG